MNRATAYNLHKFESKVDYNVTSKLRVSGRYGKHPYYNFQETIYGEALGGADAFPQSQAGNYLQNGAQMTWSVAATYVASPTLVLDVTVGKVDSHQVLMPNRVNEKVGEDVMGIPGTNPGPLPWAGGVPNFTFSGFTAMGASYPPLEYIEPLYDYMGNVTKIQGAHTIRAGINVNRQNFKGIEKRTNSFAFTGGATALRGGASPDAYNTIADFVLGLPTSTQASRQWVQPYLGYNQMQYSIYVRDNWKVTNKLTVNYGVRWEKYPVPTQRIGGIYIMDIPSRTMSHCGEGATPMDCGIKVSNKIFAPSLGIAYRPTDRTVVRAGYSLSPSQSAMGTGGFYSFPVETTAIWSGDSSTTPANWTATDTSYTLSNGLQVLTPPPSVNGVYPIVRATGNLSGQYSTGQKNFQRGYLQSWNVTVQREFGHGWLGSAGYVGMHSVHMQTSREHELRSARRRRGQPAFMGRPRHFGCR